MKWVRRQGMHLKPYKCIACGSSATPPANGQEGEVEDAYFREGLDVNWGDSVFLCRSCVWVLGQLAGFLDPDQVEDLNRRIAHLENELEETVEANEGLQKRMNRILDGSKAMKESRAAAKPTTKKKVAA